MSRVRLIRRGAFEMLFQLDAAEPPLDACGDAIVPSDDTGLGPDELTRARGMADGAWAHRRECDRTLSVVAPAWPALRMPAADRCVLRLGVWELEATDTDAAIVINEAVELAKQYGTDQSPSFVNGVLDSVRQRVESSKQAAPTTEGEG